MPGNNGSSSSLWGRRIMISGAGGFLGSHLTEHLLREGALVGALDLAEAPPCETGSGTGRLVFIRCDLADPVETQKALEAFEPEIFFHFASQPDGRETWQQAELAIQNNLQLTLNTLEGFRRCGGELFVYGDSTKVYGNGAVPYRQDTPAQPLSSYAIAKAAGWEFCRLYERIHGMHCVSVRPTMIYGPRQAFNLFTYTVKCVLEQRERVELEGGDQTRDPLYIDDAMEAYLRIARMGRRLAGQVINIGGGQERTVLELARMVTELMESPTPVIPVAHNRRPTEMARSYCDNAEAQRLLHWRPRIDLRAGLQRTIEYLVSRQGISAIPAAKE